MKCRDWSLRTAIEADLIWWEQILDLTSFTTLGWKKGKLKFWIVARQRRPSQFFMLTYFTVTRVMQTTVPTKKTTDHSVSAKLFARRNYQKIEVQVQAELTHQHWRCWLPLLWSIVLKSIGTWWNSSLQISDGHSEAVKYRNGRTLDVSLTNTQTIRKLNVNEVGLQKIVWKRPWTWTVASKFESRTWIGCNLKIFCWWAISLIYFNQPKSWATHPHTALNGFETQTLP